MTFYTDETLESIKRLSLKMDEYEQGYPGFVDGFCARNDAIEEDFLQSELEVFQDIFDHLERLLDLNYTPSSFQEFSFEKDYRRYQKELNMFVPQERAYISTERKINFLNKKMDRFRQPNDSSALELFPSDGKYKRIYTTNQITLIFHYFFSAKFLSKALDKTDIARFIHITTDRKFTKIANSDIYKRLKKVPGEGTPQGLKDLKMVMNLFLEFGLPEVAENVKKDIKSFE